MKAWKRHLIKVAKDSPSTEHKFLRQKAHESRRRSTSADITDDVEVVVTGRSWSRCSLVGLGGMLSSVYFASCTLCIYHKTKRYQCDSERVLSGEYGQMNLSVTGTGRSRDRPHQAESGCRHLRARYPHASRLFFSGSLSELASVQRSWANTRTNVTPVFFPDAHGA